MYINVYIKGNKMRRTKEKAANTKRDLLDTALTIFSQKGYESTRLEDIAKEAGVTRGAIYHHFGNKAELYVALIDQASGQGEKLVQQAVEKGGKFEDIISYILNSYFNLLEDDCRFRDVVALTLSNMWVSHDLKGLAQKRYDEAGILVENISRFFKTAIMNGQLRSDLDPDAAARALIAYQNGLAMLWLANPDVFSIKENAVALIEVFLKGIVLK
jgi:TetR/AcrR family acrAB operon transcriptional repressor